MMDIDFVQFTPDVRGMYCSLILYLTSNDSKYTFGQRALSRICNCDSVEEFEKIWQKCVSKELCKAKKILQVKRRDVLSTVKKRQHSTSTANGTANAEETKRKIKT